MEHDIITRLQSIPVDLTDDVTSSEPPRIWWRHGSRAARSGGFFYCKASDHGDLGAPWAAAAIYGDERGFVAEKLRIVVLAMRVTPFREVASGERRMRQYAASWQPGMRLHTETLILVQGGDLAVWSATGLTGKAVKAILADMRRFVIEPASQMAGRRLPLSAFWTPVQTQRDEAGNVVYAPTGFGSVITPPALPIRERATEKVISALLLDDTTLARVVELRDDIAQWKAMTRIPASSTPQAAQADDASEAFETFDDDEI